MQIGAKELKKLEADLQVVGALDEFAAWKVDL